MSAKLIKIQVLTVIGEKIAVTQDPDASFRLEKHTAGVEKQISNLKLQAKRK